MQYQYLNIPKFCRNIPGIECISRSRSPKVLKGLKGPKLGDISGVKEVKREGFVSHVMLINYIKQKKTLRIKILQKINLEYFFEETIDICIEYLNYIKVF